MTPGARLLPTDIAALVAQVGRLPPLPQAVLALQHTLSDEAASIDRCAAQIRQDPALAGRLLRLANSAFYGVPGRVGSLDDAVRLIGLRSLRMLAMTAAVSLQFPPPREDVMPLAAFWRHALATAFLAQELAANIGRAPEAAYVGGLLHDIGRLAFAVAQPERAPGWFGTPDQERGRLGFDHAELGAAIAVHWRLPDEVVAMIGTHHAPEGAGREASLADCVHVADALAHNLGFGHQARTDTPEIDARAWQRVVVGPLDIAALGARVGEAVAGTCAAFGVDTAAPPATREGDPA